MEGFTSVVVLLAFSVLGGFSAGLMGLMGGFGLSVVDCGSRVFLSLLFSSSVNGI